MDVKNAPRPPAAAAAATAPAAEAAMVMPEIAPPAARAIEELTPMILPVASTISMT